MIRQTVLDLYFYTLHTYAIAGTVRYVLITYIVRFRNLEIHELGMRPISVRVIVGKAATSHLFDSRFER